MCSIDTWKGNLKPELTGRRESNFKETIYLNRAGRLQGLLCVGSVTQMPFPYLPVFWMFERTDQAEA